MLFIKKFFIITLLFSVNLSAMNSWPYFDSEDSESECEDIFNNGNEFFSSDEFKQCCKRAEETSELDLSNFKLTTLNELPEDKKKLLKKIKILKLVNCEILNINSNFFSFFPALEILDLSNNLLFDFPDILNLKNLKELYLNNNQIKKRPDSAFMFDLIKMEKLKILSLLRNPLGDIFFWYYCKTFTGIDPSENPLEVENRPYRIKIEKKLKEIMIIERIYTPAAEGLIHQLLKS